MHRIAIVQVLTEDQTQTQLRAVEIPKGMRIRKPEDLQDLLDDGDEAQSFVMVKSNSAIVYDLVEAEEDETVLTTGDWDEDEDEEPTPTIEDEVGEGKDLWESLE